MVKKFFDKVLEEVSSRASRATLFSQFSRVANGLVILPIALSNFGAEEISFWLVLSSILGLQAFLDQGLTVTFTRYFSYQQGDGVRSPVSKAAISGRIPSFWQLRKISGEIYLTGSIVWFVSLLIYGTYQINTESYLDWKWIAWIVFTLTSSLQFYNNQNIAMLEGSGLLAKMRSLDGLFNIMSVIIILIYSRFYDNIFALIIIQQCVMLGVFVKNLIMKNEYLRGRNDWSEYDIKISRSDYLDVLRVSWKSGVGVMLSNGLLNLMVVSLTGLNGDSRIANFLLNLRIMQIVVQLSMSPFYSRIPQMANIYATANWEKLEYVGSSAIRNAMFLYVVGGACILFFGEYLLHFVITSMAVDIGWTTLLLFVTYYFERTGAMFLQYYSLTNRIVWHIANGVTAIIFISVYFLATTLGIDSLQSVILGYFIGNVVFYAPYSFSLLFRNFPTNPSILLSKSHKLSLSMLVSIVLVKMIMMGNS